ncbi:delta-lactam-biosynthetic de-N-acetylase [Pseudalkalibacillus caeni]|uniref:Delta-lactam-biosynthetic de-N-acetylase n=1 Tax=Exobacillus caeni TaxID=2574798 RepID=A0A5R9F4H5_9BACL|nr:delta-lactam-biosynthetic de-N-acetylase [Pseudalkalibacillus caeni]TLS35723.1 delta-lactam-biosynthetic de-N-acetylase [Pseudalkalibacillus caeni]
MKTFLSFILVLSSLMLSFNIAEASSSNRQHDWYFKRSKNHQPATTEPEFLDMLTKNGGMFIGNTDKKELYLTFDNGYENGYTAEILDVLKEKKVPATFFVTGHYLRDQPDLVRRMVKEGHIVGNHSWSHPNMTQKSDEKIREELEKVKEEFTMITGKKEMIYLRPPRGIFSERTLEVSNKAGYVNVFWSLAYKDWVTNEQKGWKYAYDNIMRQVHPGSIMLLHTVSKDNAKAMGKVIDDLRKQGYTFKSLDDILVQRAIPKAIYSL